MEYVVVYLTLLLCLLPLILTLIRKTTTSKQRLPPGSLGIHIIGQSFEFFRAMRANKTEEWFRGRTRKYGPISKLHLFGSPTVFLHGRAANKFIYTCSDKILANQQPASLRRLFGERNILEMSGEDHKRVRGALLSFLKPEALRQSVSKIDEEIKRHLNNHWHGCQEIQVLPTMKTLTFNIICSVIFGVEGGETRDILVQHFEVLLKGMLALPINLPFTCFNRSLRARSRIRDIVLDIVNERKNNLKATSDNIAVHRDLITSLLSMHDETSGSPLLSDEEIIDNCMTVMIAGYDTSSSLLAFLIKRLAEDPQVYEHVLNEHNKIARGKESNEPLTWEDLSLMKYTWRVASESLRMNPPILNSFRTVLKDIEIGGYVIPKGWLVTWGGFMTHMDESIFPEPLKFSPSRFDNHGDQIPPYSYIPFGAGPRMCPGYEFARIETLMMIHYVVTKFQWKLCLPDNFFARNPFPDFDQGLPIKIEPKEHLGDDTP